MGSSNRRFSFVASGYSYEPTGELERLENVRVPIWSTKAVTARWLGPGPGAPLVDADLRPVGTDRLAGTITNRQSFPLEDAILAFGKQVYLLGTLAPGATVRVELTSDRNLAGLLRGPGLRLSLRPAVEPKFQDQPGRPAAGAHVPRQRIDPWVRTIAQQRGPPRPGSFRPARPRPADARGQDQTAGRAAGPGQPAGPPGSIRRPWSGSFSDSSDQAEMAGSQPRQPVTSERTTSPLALDLTVSQHDRHQGAPR